MPEPTSVTFDGPLPPPDTAVVVVSDDPNQLPAVVGRYRIDGELGRGGLGVVYRGFDPELKRPVAIKLLLSGRWSGAGQRDRFRAEAEAVARLGHPHVVRLYEVGQADGRPFLALELVDGPTLAGVLAAAPLAPQAAAALLASLAEAVAHAHTHGVVHRDLKPANILMDDRGEPKVADFGLAKLADADGPHTHTGAVIGTPQYMAPEQAGGEAVGEWTDVYALGAVLYECLTGRPPFRAASALDTLDLVRTAAPVPPRRLQPRVPRDLEVICLHCLEKAPGRRYPSAVALLADLRAFLAGRAIVARPVGPLGRTARWAKRNPAAAGLIAFAAIALVAAGVGVGLHNRRLQAALADTRTARDRADANYRHAQDAVTRILARLDGNEFAGVARVEELRRRQQADALAFALAVAAQSGDSPAVRFDTAKALLAAGRYARALGREEESDTHLKAAAERFAALADESPDDPDYRRWHAAALLQLWPSHARAGDAAAAERVIREVIALRERVQADDADRSELALAHYNLGNLLAGQERWADAEGPYTRAAELNRATVAAAPADRSFKDRLAAALTSLSVAVQQLPGRLADVERFRDEAARLYEGLVRDDPHDLAALHGLALLRVNWAYVLMDRKEYDRALADLTATVTAAEPAWRREPDHALLTEALYRTYGVTAILHERRGDWAAAVPAWRQVLTVAPADQRPAWRLQLVLARARAGDHAGAVAEAEEVAAGLPANTPADQWAHLATVAAVAASKAPALLDKYAGVAARMLTRAKAATDPKAWPVERKKLEAETDLTPVMNHPAVRAALGS